MSPVSRQAQSLHSKLQRAPQGAHPQGAQTLAQRRDRALGAGATLFYDEPAHLVRGEGVHLMDADGTKYVDMYNNVPCVGHCHPHVVQAVREQAGVLNTHSRYLHEGIVRYAERLVDRHHAGIESVVFTCTGTEAVEVALMMARIATGRRGVICTDAAYHGNSAAVRKLGRALRRNGADGEARGVPVPETYRTQANDPAAWHLERLREVIHDFARDGSPPAALLVCPIFANEGLPNVPTGYLVDAARLIRDAGGLVIADEVQAGLGRTGRWWGSEIFGLEPDIMVMGKPLGGGMPLAAAAASRAVVENFRKRTGYFNTFAASPLQAAAGNAVLDVIEGEGLCANAAKVGAVLRAGLDALQPRCQSMGDVRGHGLFLGVEWVQDRQTKEPDRHGASRVVNAMKDRGFLIGAAGAFDNVVKLRPPLVFAREDAAAFLTAFEDVALGPT